jgi:glycosyltransferase involved in cell wall biosynthesis
MLTPSVSVIIPTFNSASTLPRAIESVLSQNWPNLEIIVVDDGSTDKTLDRIQSYLPNIKYLRQARRGSAQARNAGIDVCTGDYIALLE